MMLCSPNNGDCCQTSPCQNSLLISTSTPGPLYILEAKNGLDKIFNIVSINDTVNASLKGFEVDCVFILDIGILCLLIVNNGNRFLLFSLKCLIFLGTSLTLKFGWFKILIKSSYAVVAKKKNQKD
jgi:hypothetical protein